MRAVRTERRGSWPPTHRNLGAGTVPAPLTLTAQPNAATEWRLVTIKGIVRSVHRTGAAWQADVASHGTTFLVSALAGAGIPRDRVVVGATISARGIVKRPYPTAKDRRFAILPRSAGDVVVTSAAQGADTSGSGAGSGAGTRPASGRSGSAPRPTTRPRGANATPTAPAGAATSGADATAIDVDLVDLSVSAGKLVRVGGIIATVASGSLTLDDGTAVATADLTNDAAPALAQLAPGMPVNLVGTAQAGAPPRLVVTRAEDVIAIPDTGAAASPDSAAASDGATAPDPFASTPTAVLSTDPADLTGSEDVSSASQGSTASTLLVAGLLFGLATVGVVALLLGRRPTPRLMAHPQPGTRR